MDINQPVLSFEQEQQYRMTRLQVFNWGTFSGLHDIPIPREGFLFIGPSGSGKSTLLDAVSALLVPPRWVDFNAAAREADRSGRDRNLLSYIRGAWAELKDGDSGLIATQFIREGSTWSALGLTYKTQLGQTITLIHLLWVRGNTNNNGDVKHHYFIFERDADLRELEIFGQTDFDIRKLKQTFPEDTFSRDEFRAYCDRFCYLLGIDSDMALRLLHKTQSAKNLGDLNTFLRDFMLDKPETFDAAERLVEEFAELNEAHKAVVSAREQIQVLSPAREQHKTRETLNTERNKLQELETGTDVYREQRRMKLLQEDIDRLEIEYRAMDGECGQKQEMLHIEERKLRDLEHQHRDLGGDLLEQWKEEVQNLVPQREERKRKRDQAKNACSSLGWLLGESPGDFALIRGKAGQELTEWESGASANREMRDRLIGEKNKKAEDFKEASGEVRSLERQPSNIPAAMLDLRRDLAKAINVSEDVLPFAGELIEVKQDEKSWQGAIERVLHGFALSLLVDEQHYAALSNHINNTNLRNRLVYYRTIQQDWTVEKSPLPGSLVLKLDIKDGSKKDWLQKELRSRFDYACVETMHAFRSTERALTKQGQIKHNKSRHEKNDRGDVEDRRLWVLGFNNREKLDLYKKQAQELAEQLGTIEKTLASLDDEDRNRRERAMHAQTLSNLEWQEIDVIPLIERIAVLEKQIRETQSGNKRLQNMAKQIETQNQILEQAREDLVESKANLMHISDTLDKDREALDSIRNDPSLVPLTPHQQKGLDERYGEIREAIRLDNLDKLNTGVVQALHREQEKINREIGLCEKSIENSFAQFKRTWPAEAADMDSSLSSAPDFFAILDRLEIDGLPVHEQKFFNLLETQTMQNMAALSTYLNDGRKAIMDRMGLVNQSLRQVPFNQTGDDKTFLHIEVKDRQLPEVREFRQDIQKTLQYAYSENREAAEARFVTLRQLVDRLSSHETEDKRWRDSVLDVRQHMEFIGLELDEAGVEVEIYRSGAGKSGGQRQKLTTTCLAAALRYQLGGSDHGIPRYAPVVLDEAFDKADNEFTALAMNIFANFGFQMIVATPLKSVMTLEPYIGGACFVDISDRKISGLLLIEYDREHQKLKLPAQAVPENP